jgi:site-specific DNA-methyltransferase (adenine-specific)
MAVAIEDAGFEIRDQIMWVYGSGFPKSMSVSKAVESHLLNGKSNPIALRKTEQEGNGESYQLTGKNNGILGETRVYDRKEFSPSTNQAKQWEGWGTALKPAHEPMVFARKPIVGTVANTILTYGVGGLNIDKTRAEGERWPANFIHDGLETKWAKFFYCAKTSKRDRNEGLDAIEAVSAAKMVNRAEGSAGMQSPRAGAGRTSGSQNNHPTVKPTSLMQYLVRLVTPPNGIVLDPFMGSGSTGKACVYEDFNFIGIDMSDEYVAIAQARIGFAFKNKNIEKDVIDAELNTE